VRLYALVAADSTFAVDLFVRRGLAAEALADALFDEPALADLLAVVAVEDEDEDEAPSPF
jgi:hypothetical protein